MTSEQHQISIYLCFCQFWETRLRLVDRTYLLILSFVCPLCYRRSRGSSVAMQQNKTRRCSRDGILCQGWKRRGENIPESHMKNILLRQFWVISQHQALLFWFVLFWCHVLGVLLRAECVQGIPVWWGEDERNYWRRWMASLGGRGRMATSECYNVTVFFHRALQFANIMQCLWVKFRNKTFTALRQNVKSFTARVISKS